MPSEQPNITQKEIEDCYAQVNEIISDMRKSQQSLYESSLMLGDSMDDEDQEKFAVFTEENDDTLEALIDQIRDINEEFFRQFLIPTEKE